MGRGAAVAAGRRPAAVAGVAQVTYVDVPQLVGRPGIADWSIEDSGRGVYGHPVPGMGYKIAFDAAGPEPWSGAASEWPPDLGEQEQLLGWARAPLRGDGDAA